MECVDCSHVVASGHYKTHQIKCHRSATSVQYFVSTTRLCSDVISTQLYHSPLRDARTCLNFPIGPTGFRGPGETMQLCRAVEPIDCMERVRGADSTSSGIASQRIGLQPKRRARSGIGIIGSSNSHRVRRRDPTACKPDRYRLIGTSGRLSGNVE